MRDSDLMFWALLLLMIGGSSSPSRPGGALPAPSPSSPPSGALPQPSPADIGVGWWWYWFATEQEPLYQAAVAKELRRARRRKQGRRWEVRKTMGGTSLGATVVVFYAFEPFRWELPGLPQPAPRGLDTDWADVAWAIPEPPSELRRMVERAAKQAWEYLRELAEGRRPPRDPFPAPSR